MKTNAQDYLLNLGCNDRLISHFNTPSNRIIYTSDAMEEYKDQAVKELEDKFERDYQRFKQEYKAQEDADCLCLAVSEVEHEFDVVKDQAVKEAVKIALQIASSRATYIRIGKQVAINPNSILICEEEVLKQLNIE